MRRAPAPAQTIALYDAATLTSAAAPEPIGPVGLDSDTRDRKPDAVDWVEEQLALRRGEGPCQTSAAPKPAIVWWTSSGFTTTSFGPGLPASLSPELDPEVQAGDPECEPLDPDDEPAEAECAEPASEGPDPEEPRPGAWGASTMSIRTPLQ